MVSARLSAAARELWTSTADLERAVWRLFLVFAFCVPWSIAASQVTLVLLAALAARHWWLVGMPSLRTPLDLPILAFVATGVLAAFVGLDVAQGLWGLRTYLQVVLVHLVVLHVRSEERMLALVRAWFAGMVLTSLHTIWNVATPWPLPEVFPGGMTESGQLLFGLGFAASLVVARVGGRLIPLALGLFTVALLANLKRGAWLGTLAAISIVGLARSRRLIVATFAVVALVVVAVGPVRDRIGHSARDVLLPGSRVDIWAAAVDVTRRFPMGIGRKNGTILRDYPNIPQRHKHAHNNVLQVAMENGILGLAAFLWWMIRFGRLSSGSWRALPRTRRIARAIAIAVFATFVGFHVAGLFEFNFGDTEVLQLLFLVMGFGLVVADWAAEARRGATPVAPESSERRAVASV